MAYSGTNLETENVIWLQEESVDVCLGKEKAFGEKVRESGQAVLLLWRGAFPAVVVGRSQVIRKEVNEEVCASLNIPIFRRISGGGAVLQTSDVYNYSLLLPERNALNIKTGFRLGTGFIQDTLRHLGLESAVQGVSDVTVTGRKISGNAIAQVNRVLLVHGTLLTDIDMPLMEACLRYPSREPEYREKRSHREFVTTLADLGQSTRQLPEALEAVGSRLLQRLA